MGKRVFISYSWDSQEHQEWVVSLANTLRSVYGIEAIVDNFLVVSNLNRMMVQEISSNDKVIIVVTKKYTEKANSFSGGVGYETELLLNYIQSNPNKIIVIMREVCAKPFYLQNYYHIDFSNNENMSTPLDELVLRIKDSPNYVMEEVNKVNPKQVKPKKVSSLDCEADDEDMITDIERILSITGSCFNAKGKLKCATWIKDFGYEIVVDSVKTSIQQYLKMDNNGKCTKESVHLVFDKIGGICKNKYLEKTKPYVAGTRMIINYCKKKFYVSYYNEQNLNSILGFLLFNYYKLGMYDEQLEMLLQYARISKSIADYIDKINKIKDDFD